MAVGPRSDEELPGAREVQALLQRLGEALACRKVPRAPPYKLTEPPPLSTLLSTPPSLCVCLRSVLHRGVGADAAQLHRLAGLQTR